jgi:hypothetical protein
MDGVPYVRAACKVLFGECPSAQEVTDQVCVDLIMSEWDGRPFEGNPELEKVARLALCEVGLACHEREDGVSFHIATERLREMYPLLGATEITPGRMRLIIACEEGLHG